MYIESLVTALEHMLGLKRPVTIKRAKYIRRNSDGWFATNNHNASLERAYGYWWLDSNLNHEIVLAEEFLDQEGILVSVIAHEYVHAWQWETFENGRRLHHGKRDYFVQWGEYIKQELGIVI